LSLLRPRFFLQHNVMFGFGSLSFMSCNVFRKHNVWFSCASLLRPRRVLPHSVWFG
jgi:hypothetical protein